jgi:hypothetical protein
MLVSPLDDDRVVATVDVYGLRMRRAATLGRRRSGRSNHTRYRDRRRLDKKPTRPVSPTIRRLRSSRRTRKVSALPHRRRAGPST